MFKAVIFDVDGTLVDSVDAHAESWTRTLRDFGHDTAFDKVRYQIGKGGDQLMKEFLTDEEIRHDGKKIEDARSKLFQREYLPHVRGFPGVRELFQRLLADRKQVVLASSANGEELDAYKQKAGISGLVQDETSRDDAGKSKPHPDIFQAALKKLGSPPPADVLVVGDSPWDAIAAQKTGLKTLGLLCGGFPESDLRAAGCFAIYRDPYALLKAYDDSPLAT